MVTRVKHAVELVTGAALGYVTVSLAESLLHAGVQHASVRTRRRLRSSPGLGRAVARAHVSHSVVHHRLTYRRDHVTQFLGPQDEVRVRCWIMRHTNRNRIVRDRYGLSLAIPDGIITFVLPVLPMFGLYALKASRSARLGLAFPLMIYPLASAGLHPYLHMSVDEIECRATRPVQRLLATRGVRFVARHHYVHHRDERYNFNLLPLGDWILGRSRPPSVDELAEMKRLGMLV